MRAGVIMPGVADLLGSGVGDRVRASFPTAS
jgi:hypothetical protein